MCRAAALLLLAWGFAATAQAQPATLRLACQGTTTDSSEPDAKKYTVSMGIVVNFTDHTVQGFYLPELLEIHVKITAANKVVALGGQGTDPSTLRTTHASVD